MVPKCLNSRNADRGPSSLNAVSVTRSPRTGWSSSTVSSLLARCGARGPISVYNAAFETSRIREEFAERFPDLVGPLLDISARVVDLLPVARCRHYHFSQQGSWSIKDVLPAAVPELSYDALAGVKDGAAAMDAYGEAIRLTTTVGRRREIEQQFLAYCRLDTFGLVRLWQFLSGRSAAPLAEV